MRTEYEKIRARNFIARLSKIKGGLEGEPVFQPTATCKETNEIQTPQEAPYNPFESRQKSLFEIDEHSLNEIGKAMGISRERVTQIEAKALRKLRHPSRSKVLREYL